MKYQGKAAPLRRKQLRLSERKRGNFQTCNEKVLLHPVSVCAQCVQYCRTQTLTGKQAPGTVRLCLSSKWLQAADYLLRMLQYNVACLVSVGAVTWLTAASLDKGSKGLCALLSATHRRNEQDNNLSRKSEACSSLPL